MVRLATGLQLTSGSSRNTGTAQARPTAQATSTSAASPAQANAILSALEQPLVSLIQTPFQVADLPNGSGQAGQYDFRESYSQIQAAVSSAHVKAMGEVGIRGDTKQAKSFWSGISDFMVKNELCTIKCLNASAYVGEHIKGPMENEGFHVYQVGVKAFDHHLVLVTPQPLNLNPGEKITADKLPPGSVAVDMWQHFISVDNSVEVVQGQKGKLGHDKLTYSKFTFLAEDVDDLKQTGFLSTLDSGKYINKNDKSEVTMYTPITEAKGSCSI